MKPVPQWFLQAFVACVVTAGVSSTSASANAQQVVGVQSFLTEGRLADGAAAMQKRIGENPNDQNARFSLGMIQFFQAVENLGQNQYRFGLLSGRNRSLPMMRLPVPENPKPEQISYQKARALVQTFVDDLQKAQDTLNEVKAKGVRLPIDLGRVHLDLNGNGKVAPEESIWAISQALQNPRQSQMNPSSQAFPIVFDAGDVVWLKGYCHAFSAVGEVILAYDWQDQFERTAHLFYPDVDTPYEFLTAEGTGAFFSFGAQNIFDFVAWLHTINYEVKEPQRMKVALSHMESVIELSRESWKLIEAEDDDEREWVPNSNQTTVMGGLVVGQETIAGWHEFLDEMEAILQGKKLVPFWRGIKGGIAIPNVMAQNPEIGINVRKIFTDPQRLDLALWLQGTGLVPFLEKGNIVDPKDWSKMMRSFRGNFFNYFFWFN